MHETSTQTHTHTNEWNALYLLGNSVLNVRLQKFSFFYLSLLLLPLLPSLALSLQFCFSKFSYSFLLWWDKHFFFTQYATNVIRTFFDCVCTVCRCCLGKFWINIYLYICVECDTWLILFIFFLLGHSLPIYFDKRWMHAILI